MKIFKERITLELDELHEDSVGVEIPYHVERIENDNSEVIWFGLETNWKCVDGNWHVLNGGEWVESDKPTYEKLFESAKREKYRKKVANEQKKHLTVDLVNVLPKSIGRY